MQYDMGSVNLPAGINRLEPSNGQVVIDGVDITWKGICQNCQ